MKRFIVPILLGWSLLATQTSAFGQCSSGPLPSASYPRRAGALTLAELDLARVAWKYFENNVQTTGLANAVDNYPSTTMWDTASYLAAVVAVRELGIINPQAADERLAKLLATLNQLKLFRNELPNKVYHTVTLEQVDYANKPGELGFSALDLGRLLIWLKIVKERYPQHADAVDKFVLRWNFENVVDRTGIMFGAMLASDQKTKYVQEGRLGYEEYSAKGFQLWGIDTELASRPEPYATAPIYCVEVPYDSRDPRKFSQHNYVVSESYVLDGLEFNWGLAGDRNTAPNMHSNAWMLDFANRVYQAQENRFNETSILTARSEHQLAEDPYFVYDTIFTDGYAWNTITESGKFVPQYAAVSLKAALGMWVLWKSDYTDRLFSAIDKSFDPQRGYYEGILENGKGLIKTFTANNNGIMLEALLFKSQGKLLKWGDGKTSLWDRTLSNPYGADARTRLNLSRPLLERQLPALGSQAR